MKVFKNFLYNVGYQILKMILPLITAPYIARVLGAESIGIYSYTYSIAYYFVLFGQLGLSVYGNRTIAYARDNKEKLNKTFCSLYYMQLIISIMSISIYVIYVAVFAKRYNLFFWIQLVYVVSTLFDINWFYFGIEKFKLTVTRNTIVKITSVILILTIVKTKEDLVLYTVIIALGTLLGQIALWTRLNKYIEFRKCNFKECIVHLKPMLILFLPTIATSLYRVMDKIMLGSVDDISQLGFYENSEKFISISMGVINALGIVMIPKISNLIAASDFKKIKEYINKSMEGIFIIASPLAFGLAAISDKLSVIFYGNEFVSCSNIIKLLSVSIIFSAWANVLRTQYLVPNKKDKEYIVSMFVGAIANIIINIMLIPKIGAIGAAIGTIIAELGVAVMHSIYVRKELELIKYIKMIFPYILLGIIMFSILRLINTYIAFSVIGLVMLIICGGLLYIAETIIYLIVSKSQYYYILKSIIIKLKKRKLTNV